MALPSPEEVQAMMDSEDQQSSLPSPDEVQYMMDTEREEGSSPLAFQGAGEFLRDNAFGNVLAGGAAGIAKPIGGGMEWLGDYINEAPLLQDTGLGNWLQREGNQIQDESAFAASQSRENYTDKYPSGGLVYDVGSTALSAAPGIALSVANPGAGAAYFSGQAALPKYGEYRDDGMDPFSAGILATGYGVGTSKLERIGLNKAFGLDDVLTQGAGALARKVAGGAGTEAVTEGAQSLLESSMDYLTKPIDQKPGFGEAVSNAGYEGLVGGIVGAPMTAAGHFTQGMRQKQAEAELSKQLEVDAKELSAIKAELEKTREARVAQGVIKDTSASEIAPRPPEVDIGLTELKAKLPAAPAAAPIEAPIIPADTQATTEAWAAEEAPQPQESALTNEQILSDPEAGAVVNFPQAIVDAATKTRARVAGWANGMRNLSTIDDLSTLEPDTRDVMEKMLETWYGEKRAKYARFRGNLAKISPLFKPVFQGIRSMRQTQNVNMADAGEILAPFISLPKDTKQAITKALVTQRLASEDGKAWNETPENLSKHLGLTTPEAQAGYMAVRESMQDAALKIRKALLTDIPSNITTQEGIVAYEKKVEELYQNMKNAYYVPFTRFGKLTLTIDNYKDPETGKVSKYFSLFETETERNVMARKLSAQGYTKSQMRHGTLKEKLTNGVELMPAEIVQMAYNLGIAQPHDPVSAPQEGNAEFDGFKGKLLKSQLMPGWSTNIERAILDYAMGVSMWHGSKTHAPILRKALTDIQTGGDLSLTLEDSESGLRKNVKVNNKRNQNSKLYKFAKEEINRALNKTDNYSAIRKFYAAWHLSKPVSAVVNTTQFGSTHLPLAMKYAGPIQGPKLWAKGLTTTMNAKKNPEFSAGLKLATKRGTIDEGAANLIRGAKNAGPKKAEASMDYDRAVNMATALFGASEKLLRVSGFATGWEIANQKGLKGDQRQALAEEFTREANFDYSPENLPPIFDGVPGLFLALRGYPFFYIDFIGKMLGEKAAGAVFASLAFGLAAGGVKFVPGVRDLWNQAENLGYDPAQWIRAFMKDTFGEENGEFASDVFMSGLPAANSPIDLSGNMAGMEFLSSDMSATGWLKLFGGVGGGMVSDVNRFKTYLDRGLPPSQAAEAVIPPALKGPVQGGRWQDEQMLRNYSNGVAVDRPPTNTELIWKWMGGRTTAESRASEKQHSAALVDEQVRDNDNINIRIANRHLLGVYAAASGKTKEAAQYKAEANKMFKDAVAEHKETLAKVADMFGKDSKEYAEASSLGNLPNPGSIKSAVRKALGEQGKGKAAQLKKFLIEPTP